tara:strand:- start:133 stop:375 length:243 start_codon:yes stop_codon:yes gene_type:complete
MGRFKRKETKVTGIQVKVFNNNIEKALRKFKKKVKDSNLMLDLRKNNFYEKPSDRRRRKDGLAKSRERYRQLKQNEKNYR